MFDRWWRFTLLAGLLSCQTAAADDTLFPTPAWHLPAARAASWDVPLRLTPLEPGRARGESFADVDPARVQPADRGWGADDRAFSGDLSMQRGESANSFPPPEWRSAPNRMELDGGTLCGRLWDRGHPLVNCQVVIVPMIEERGVCRFDSDRQTLNAVTDEDGAYRFENVPAGGYKLTWLPAGQTRWIRRIAMSPDVKVRRGETTNLKEIRVALQTIN